MLQFRVLDLDGACPSAIEQHLRLHTDAGLVAMRQQAKLSSEQDLVQQVRTIASLPTTMILNSSKAFLSKRISGRGGRAPQRPFADVRSEIYVRGLKDEEYDRSTWSARLDWALAYQPQAPKHCNLIHAGETISHTEYKSHLVLPRNVLQCGRRMQDLNVTARCSLRSEGGTLKLRFELQPSDRMAMTAELRQFLHAVVEGAAHAPLTECDPAMVSGPNEHMLTAVDEDELSIKFSDLFLNERDSPDWVHLLALGHAKFVATEDDNELPMPGLPEDKVLIPIDMSSVKGDDITTKEWTETGHRLEAVCDRPEGSRRQRPAPGAYTEDPLTPKPKRISVGGLGYRSPSVSPGTSPAPTPHNRKRSGKNMGAAGGRSAAGGNPPGIGPGVERASGASATAGERLSLQPGTAATAAAAAAEGDSPLTALRSLVIHDQPFQPPQPPQPPSAKNRLIPRKRP